MTIITKDSCVYCLQDYEGEHEFWCPVLKQEEDCSICYRQPLSQFKKNCHYLLCPYKDFSMPVKVELKRTLWLLPLRSGASAAHAPFLHLFDRAVMLKPELGDCIREHDAVFFDGGNDIDPALYGEEPHIMTAHPDKLRDEFEKWAFQQAQASGAACLGVCRGAQFLCALSGGKLVQQVGGHGGPGHLIRMANGTTLFSESSHHQVMWPFEISHVLIAHAQADEKTAVSDEYGKDFPDGELPEIIYCKDTRSLCIQGHTEWVDPNSEFAKLTKKLVNEFLIEGR